MMTMKKIRSAVRRAKASGESTPSVKELVRQQVGKGGSIRAWKRRGNKPRAPQTLGRIAAEKTAAGGKKK